MSRSIFLKVGEKVINMKVWFYGLVVNLVVNYERCLRLLF
jgi:hypothetical protein